MEELRSMENDNTALLGSTVTIEERSPSAFRTAIGQFVDSPNDQAAMSPSPLVEVCCLFHNWEVCLQQPDLILDMVLAYQGLTYDSASLLGCSYMSPCPTGRW